MADEEISLLFVFRTVFELRVAEIEILAGSHRIFLGSLRLLDPLQILAHRVDGTVHVQQLTVQILLGALVSFATARIHPVIADRKERNKETYPTARL